MGQIGGDIRRSGGHGGDHDDPSSPKPSPRGAEAHLLVLAGDSIETNLCAIIAGRATYEERSLDPTGGTKAALFPHYFPAQPACKTEFLRRRTDKLCYACNKDKAECRDGSDVWKYAICPHHGPRVDEAGLAAAKSAGLTVTGAGGRDGRGK